MSRTDTSFSIRAKVKIVILSFGTAAMNYYLVVDGRRQGPFALEELAARGLERDSLVWSQGLTDWMRADKVPALNDLLATIPPPLPAWVASPGSEEAESTDTESACSPSALQRLYRWWLYLFAAPFLLPLFGGLCLLLAEVQRVPVTTGRYTYYRYTEAGEGLLVLGAVSIGVAVVPLIGSIVIFAVLLYKMWSVIQDGRARTTPDKAVGFLFIPFFNLYWVFVAVHGLAVDLNSYVRRHRAGMDAEPAPTHLALIFCILLACTAVPYVGLLTVMPLAVVLFFLVTRLKNCVTAILRVQQATAAKGTLGLDREECGQERAVGRDEPSPHVQAFGHADRAVPPVR